MKLKVGMLRYDTQRWQSEKTSLRLMRMEVALEELEVAMAHDRFDPSQPLHAVFLSPEYMFARRTPPEFNDHTRAHVRQMEVERRDKLLDRLRELSVQHPRILIVPGTVAWRKPIDSAQDKFLGKITKYATRLHEASRFNNQHVSGKPLGSYTLFGLEDSLPERLPVPTHDAKLDHLLSATYVARNTAYCWLGGRCLYKYHKIGDFYEVIHQGAGGVDTVHVPAREVGRFPAVGLDISISICADQSMADIQKLESGELVFMQKTRDPVDIHILLSANIQPAVSLANLKPKDSVLLSCSSHDDYNSAWQVSGARLPHTDKGALRVFDVNVREPAAPGVPMLAAVPGANM